MNTYQQSAVFVSPPFLQVEAFGIERVRDGEMHPPSPDDVLGLQVLLEQMCGGAASHQEKTQSFGAVTILCGMNDMSEGVSRLPVGRVSGLGPTTERILRTGRALESLRAGKYQVDESVLVVPWRAYSEKIYTLDGSNGIPRSVVMPLSYSALQKVQNTIYKL
jgi:hypothetical protein